MCESLVSHWSLQNRAINVEQVETKSAVNISQDKTNCALDVLHVDPYGVLVLNVKLASPLH